MHNKCKVSSYKPIHQLQHCRPSNQHPAPPHPVYNPPVYPPPVYARPNRLPRKTSCDSGNQSLTSSEHSPNNTCNKHSANTCTSNCSNDRDIYAHVTWDTTLSSDTDSAYSSKSCLNTMHNARSQRLEHHTADNIRRAEQRDRVNTLLTSRHHLHQYPT